MQICCFRIFSDSYNTFQQMPSAAGPALQGKSEALRVWIATGCKNDGYNDKHAACAQFPP